MAGYVARTLIRDRTFTVTFHNADKLKWYHWIAMQFVGMAINIAGSLRIDMGDIKDT